MKVLFIIGLTFVFLGCSGARITPDLAAPKCDAVEAHLVEVGCFNDEQCASFVREIVREQITNRMPDEVKFKAYCDIALMSGLLPVDCVMKAVDVPGILKCVRDWGEHLAQVKK
jgi:hypothetical protein